MTQMTVYVMILYGWFKLLKQSNLQLFNEWCLLLSCYLYFTLTDFVPDAKTRYQVGFYLIWVITFNFAVNVIMILMHFVHKLLKFVRILKIKNELRLRKAKIAKIRKAIEQERKR